MVRREERMMVLTSSQIVVDQMPRVLARKGISMPVVRCGFDQTLEYARAAVDRGVRVLISRGYTAAILREHLNIAVLDIKMTCFDFLSAATQARQIGQRIAFVGYKDIWEVYLEQYRQLLGNPVIVYIRQPNELRQTLTQLKGTGTEVVVGGGTTCNIARELGMSAVHIGAEDGAIEDALAEAEHLLRVELDRAEKYDLISSLLNSVSEGVAAVDPMGRIINCNRSAAGILGEDWEGVSLAGCLSKPEIVSKALERHTVTEELVEVRGTLCTVSGSPLLAGESMLGATFTIQPVRQVHMLEQTIRKKLTQTGNRARYSFQDIIGASPAMTAVKEKARQYARSNSTILITGETGTGKELFSQSIHNHSPRSRMPFVAINCAALPQDILESELFGYVKGAFTGARSEGKAGVFETAHQGTILLDEIGEISVEMQLKLLRVLQEREIRRIGDDKALGVDVRVIAATNKDLYQEMLEGRFRRDLYYRLAVLELELPPLRQRREDIPDLVTFLLHSVADREQVDAPTITPAALRELSSMDWPGNVRQLRNVVERLIAVNQSRSITREMVLDVVGPRREPPAAQFPAPDQPPAVHPASGVNHIEAQAIAQALRAEHGNRTRAARRLNMSKSTLWRKLEQLTREDPDFIARALYQ